jgi:hypothetical protein
MRQIEFGGVLCGQHDGNLLHAAERLQDVRSQHPIGIDLRIVEEAIRRLKLGPVERLRKRALRTLRQPTRECDESLRQARVAQIRRAELVARPIVKVIGARQCGTSLSMKLREANIVCRGLQANHSLLTKYCA